MAGGHLARVIPPEARVVALAYPSGGAENTAGAAAGIAAAVGLRREHTLLVATETGSSSLDGTLGGGDSAGLSGALGGRARLAEVAVREESRPYTYLPAGGEPPPPTAFLVSGKFRRFAEQVRERGGTLLIHMPEGALAREEVAELLDGYVSLGRLSAPPPSGVPEYGRVPLAREGSPPSPGRAEGTPREEGARPAEEARPGKKEAGRRGRSEGRWRRHRLRARPLVARVALSALLIVVLVGGWWFLARESLTFRPGDAAPLGAAADRRAEGGVGEAVEGEEAGARTEEPAGGVLLAAAEAAPELPYSVLIASYARAADAHERVAQLERWRGTIFYVAPTPVRGSVYHRVFAGARSDGESARGLMEELVRGGRKEASSAWDVRPARLAFRLGIFPEREAARSAVREAAVEGIPAYILAAAAAGPDSAFQVYAGGYESEPAARALAAILERAGRETALVARRGEPR